MSWIIWLVVLLAALVVTGWVLRKIGRLFALVVMLCLAAAIIVAGAWVLIDSNDLSQHFYQDDKLVLLDIDTRVAGAFVLGESKIPRPIGDMAGIIRAYPDLSKIKGNYYKVIVMDWSVVEGNISIPGFKATGREIRSAMVSGKPRDLLIKKSSEALGGGLLADITAQAIAMYPSEEMFASSMFAILAAEPLSNPDKMLKGMKEGKVIVYPETIVFKTIKFLPLDLARLLVPS
ncbi:MAG: hypothetical protein QXM31_00870 [Candidatus Woesearchaeota archaeon]